MLQYFLGGNMRVEDLEIMYKMKTILCKIKSEMRLTRTKTMVIGDYQITSADIDKYTTMVDRFDKMLQENREKTRIRMSEKRKINKNYGRSECTDARN